ncbi:unnamed protein product, partial [Amoebophrya sp. A25]|eukprot:GSA25T00023504001.1
MSLVSVTEIALHLKDFRNVDLFHQGLYRLHAIAYQEPCPGVVSYATCVRLLDGGVSDVEKVTLPSQICTGIHEYGSYLSRAFLIRYCEEEVELNEGVVFRIEQQQPISSCGSTSKRIKRSRGASGGGANVNRLEGESGAAWDSKEPTSLAERSSRSESRCYSEDNYPAAVENNNEHAPVGRGGSSVEEQEGVLNLNNNVVRRSRSASEDHQVEGQNAEDDQDINGNLNDYPEEDEDDDDDLHEGEVILEVELLFADLTALGGPEVENLDRIVHECEFKSASRRKFILHQTSCGIHEYVPVLFDEFHFSFLKMHIHSATLDVRRRIRPLGVLMDATAAAEAREQLLEELTSLQVAGGDSLSNVLGVDSRMKDPSRVSKGRRTLSNRSTTARG